MIDGRAKWTGWLMDKLSRPLPEGCLLWEGPKFSRGYGIMMVSGNRNKRAHHVAYEWTKGPIPAGMVICHSCDNPACVNPKHLFAATQSDNIRDCVTKGRHWQVRKTHCPKGHPLTPDNLLAHRKKDRICRQCNLIYQRSYYRTKRNQKENCNGL